MDGERLERFPQAAGGLGDDRRAEVLTEMEHVLALVRLQPADEDDDAFIMFLAQPAGERGDVEFFLHGNKITKRLL